MSPEEAPSSSIDQGISVLTVPDVHLMDAPFLDALAAKYRDWRIEVLSIPGVAAFGNTPLEVEQSRTLDWYKRELVDPSVVLAVAVQHPKTTDAGNRVQPSDMDLLLNGRWFGSTTNHWPIAEADYTLPSHDLKIPPESPQERSRNGNAFVLPAYRKRKDAFGNGIMASVLHQATVTTAQKVMAKHPGKTVYLRMLNSVGPQAIQNPKVLPYFEKISGFVPTGRVPQVVSALLNETPMQKWPSPDENPGFYKDCWWTIGERIMRVDEHGYTVITRELLNDSSSKL